MSATFKIAKKKKQLELRKCMNDHKEKAQKTVKKVESPLAKYNEAGQLTCALCKSIVRSEAVWAVHINAKQHKQNVALAKKLKENTNNFTTSLKRPLTPPMDVPTKKVKSILKNAPTTVYKSNIVVVNNDTPNVSSAQNNSSNRLEVPNDFFDTKTNKLGNNKLQKKTDEKMDIEEENPSETIPEGFFDDPKLDAKARNIEYKDPKEEEWDKFQKEIKDANHDSAAIIAEDQDEATNERQIDEIEEQMKNWSRVVSLEKKKVEIISNMKDENNMDDNESSTDDENFDEFLDWRAKKSFK